MLFQRENYKIFIHTQEGNEENGLVINRNNEMKTLSITQAVVHQNKVSILHYDLVEQLDFNLIYHHLNTTILKLFFHKITIREYWPFQIVIFLFIFLWSYYSIKAKSIFSLMLLIPIKKWRIYDGV
jgi:hypothetical protein